MAGRQQDKISGQKEMIGLQQDEISSQKEMAERYL